MSNPTIMPRPIPAPILPLMATDDDLESAASALRTLCHDCLRAAAKVKTEPERALFTKSADSYHAAASRIEAILDERFEQGREIHRCR